ncbi:hypothetical protein ACQR0Z_07830 [Bradyrhizobium sp. HKCCYLS3077]|uniref:hypothetical protein n=1 Tax=unclassified Bradyrhizobium TaxID=2631580 RepID=UPI003EBD00A1
MTFSKTFATSALVAVTLAAGAAFADERPTFEAASLPATQHQLAVIGASAAEEQAPVADLIRAGMPATPLQLAVLTPHRRSAALAPSTIGNARN